MTAYFIILLIDEFFTYRTGQKQLGYFMQIMGYVRRGRQQKPKFIEEKIDLYARQ